MEMTMRKTKNTMMMLTGAALLSFGVAGAALAERGQGEGHGRGHDMMPILNFEAMDADKSGGVTKEEIAAYRAAQVTKADADKDGKLNAAEVAAFQMAEMQDRMADRAARMIKAFDSDGDGLLSADELAAGPKQISVFDRVDANGDGSITKDEADAAQQKFAGRMGRHGGGSDGVETPEN
jgi:EF hand